MKTVAIKVDDDLHAQLLVVAQLEGVTLTEVIRSAVELHIAQLSSGDALAGKAKGFLDAIDEEARSRKHAVQSLMTQLGAGPAAKARRPRSSKSNGKPE